MRSLRGETSPPTPGSERPARRSGTGSSCSAAAGACGRPRRRASAAAAPVQEAGRGDRIQTSRSIAVDHDGIVRWPVRGRSEPRAYFRDPEIQNSERRHSRGAPGCEWGVQVHRVSRGAPVTGDRAVSRGPRLRSTRRRSRRLHSRRSVAKTRTASARAREGSGVAPDHGPRGSGVAASASSSASRRSRAAPRASRSRCSSAKSGGRRRDQLAGSTRPGTLNRSS